VKGWKSVEAAAGSYEQGNQNLGNLSPFRTGLSFRSTGLNTAEEKALQ